MDLCNLSGVISVHTDWRENTQNKKYLKSLPYFISFSRGRKVAPEMTEPPGLKG